MGEELREVGRVSHFFGKINVAIIEVSATISIGDQIIIKGPTTDNKQVVESMEIDHVKVKQAESGQSIGMKVTGRVKA